MQVKPNFFFNDNSIHIDVLEHINHTFNQPCTSVIKDVSPSESHEGFDFFSGTIYADCVTITEPVDDVIEVELDDDANGDGVAKGDAGAFVFCNNDLTAVDSSIGSDMIVAAIFWATIREQFLFVGKLLFYSEW